MEERGNRTARVLLEGGLISEDLLQKAEEQQKKTGLRLTQVLIALGVSAEAIRQSLATRLKIPEMVLQGRRVDPDVTALCPESWVQKHGIIPLERMDNFLILGMVNPFNFEVIKDIRFKTGLNVQAAVISEAELPGMIEICYGGSHASEVNLDQVLKDIGSDKIEVLPQDHKDEEVEEEFPAGMGSDAPVIRLVDRIIQDAVTARATDIHIEPARGSVRVRYRIDGVLRDTLDIPKYCQGPLLSRVKVMGSMDISDKRRPQDGRSKLKMGNRLVDIRISSLPTMYGEKIVLRLLEQRTGDLSLEAAGFTPHVVEALKGIICHPQGMVLATGPTGSGKSTTLYTLLAILHNGTTNIVTVEDPVEYQIAGINQVQINIKSGLTFANGLRAILRQDPDVVLVGEMRDQETAEIAFHAAQTGHVVLTTLHTNDAASSITRLLAMGIDPYLLTSSVLGFSAQRLLRRLCAYCKMPASLNDDLTRWLPPESTDSPRQVSAPRGCEKCRDSGFWGRIPVAEVLVPNDTIRDMILRGRPDREITAAARKAGMKTMFEDAMYRVAQGLTTFGEVTRVLGPPREHSQNGKNVPLMMIQNKETVSSSS